jgi:hypothetical protein
MLGCQVKRCHEAFFLTAAFFKRPGPVTARNAIADKSGDKNARRSILYLTSAGN